MGRHSLSQLVRIYERKHAPRIVEYLGYFKKLKSLDDAIKFACHGRDGKTHGHQRRVGKETLEKAKRKLQSHAQEITSCKSFDDLLACVESHTSAITRFGILAVYDTSLRLGAHLNRWPKLVYLHAGTKKGCIALGLPTSGHAVEMEEFPKPIRALKPYQAEDFLCIFKDQLGGAVVSTPRESCEM